MMALALVLLGTIAAFTGIAINYPRVTALGLIALYAGGFALGFAAVTA